MARKRNPLALWCKTTLTLLLLWSTKRVPLSLIRRFGRRMGRLAYYVIPRVRNIGLKNLNLAYGDTKNDQEKKAILMESMENLGILLVEFVHAPLLRTEKRDSLVEVKGLKYLKGTNGGTIIGAHLGNWEWMAGAFGDLEYKSIGIVRPLRDPRLNDAVEKLRGGTGIRTIGKKDAGAEIIKAVREGSVVGILIDQSARKNGVPVTFFEQPCWATVGPVMVAMRTQTPIYPVSMVRSPTGFYTLEFFPPITVERTGNIHQDLIDGSQRCQDIIEEMVRKNPGQWMWIHDRWKPQPILEKQWDKRLDKS